MSTDRKTQHADHDHSEHANSPHTSTEKPDRRSTQITRNRCGRQAPAGATRMIYRIENMDCATEEGVLRNALGGLAKIKQLGFDLMRRAMLPRSISAIDATKPRHGTTLRVWSGAWAGARAARAWAGKCITSGIVAASFSVRRH